MTRGVFVDEVLYFNTSYSNSFTSILTLGAVIKDHGILYLLILKLLTYFTTKIELLRLTNLLLYLAEVFLLFRFFQNFRKSLLSLFFVFLISFFPYFVLTNTYVSPYNLVFFLTTAAFISISNFILFSKTRKERLYNSVLFLITSSLAFYADYSVIYFYITLIPVVFFVYLWYENQAENLTLLGLANLILISPGLCLISKNFSSLQSTNLNATPNMNFFVFFGQFSDTLLISLSGYLSSVIVVLSLISVFVLMLKSSNKSIKYLTFFALSGILCGILFLHIFNNSYFNVFTERTFWYFYFLLFLVLYSLMYHFSDTNKKYLAVLMAISLIFLSLKYFQPYEGVFGKNIGYGKLTDQLINNPNYKGNVSILFYDRNYYYVPFQEYYFLGLNELDKNKASSIKKYFSNKRINILNNYALVNHINVHKNSKLIVIFLDQDQIAFGQLKKFIILYEKHNNVTVKNYFYIMNCNDGSCAFVYST